MAKTRGPLLSAEARGKFGNSVLFQEGKSGSIARMMFKPKNRKTVFQQSNRSNITFGVDLWQTLDIFTKFIWEFVKDVKHLAMSGYNFFLSEYNTSRTAGQPTKLYPDDVLFSEYPIPNNLTYWWKLDKGIGNTITDYISNVSGTITGATWVDGKINKCLYFNGSSNYATPNVRFSSWAEKTIEFWLYAQKTYPWQITVKEGDYDSNKSCGFILSAENRLWLFQTYAGGTNKFQTWTPAYPSFLNTWHHVTGIISRSEGFLKIYVDAVLAGSYIDANIKTAAFFTPNNPVFFGGSPGATSGEYFQGKIDEIKIYERILTPAEVLHNYRIGS